MSRSHVAPLVALLFAFSACNGQAVVGGYPSGDAAINDLGPFDAGDTSPPPADTEDAAPDVTDVADAFDAPDDGLAPGTCDRDEDCAMSADGAVCDLSTRRCVQCTASRDTCPVGQFCDGTRCAAGCNDDGDCAALASGLDGGTMGGDAGDGGSSALGLRCLTTTRACVECITDAHCRAGSLCVGNLCAPGCNESRACPTGLTCCTGACIDAQSNIANCGACGTRCAGPNAVPACLNGNCTISMCAAGFEDCDMRLDNGCEVDTRTSLSHCGGCGRVCAARPNATASCDAGTCRHTCATGFADCDGDPANGCEVDLRASTSHCGACGARCDPSNGVAACRAGVCAIERCNATHGDCDGNVTNGCETDLRVAVLHCGMCGTSCPSQTNASPTCVAGACATVCTSGFQDCDGVTANGCEADLRTSVDNCGACGRACRPAGGSGVCMGGVCSVRACDAGRADCDGDPSNGCEADTTRDLRACGMCGVACPSPAGSVATCASGTCSFTCNTGLANCDGVASNGCETDTRVTTAHCGGCGMACADRTNSAATCSAGRCAYTCDAGFADCDGNPANGCEVDTRTSSDHCGACGRVCRVAGGAGVCTAGSCSVSACDRGLADCDMNPTNGCETDVAGNVRSCGGCGVVCPSPAGSAATCASGACGFACNVGLADCNRVTDDGCEVDTRTSTAHCGGCGMACATRAGASATCVAGGCVYACNAGFADCDGVASNGCEVDLRTSLSHCGACGRACTIAGGAGVCAAGACQVRSCDAGRANCDSDPTNGCETSIASDVTACGACGVRCPSRAGADVTCTSGTCGFTCLAGLADCNGSPTDGCEVDTRVTAAHCGGCGRACAARPNAAASCAASACVYTCATGFADCDGVASNGCEVDLRSTPSSCGACGRACAVANGTAGCASGACTVASCNSGFGNCDGSAANGCEVALGTSSANCGACGVACPSGQSCYASRCSATCGDARSLGFAGCVNIASSGSASAASSYVSSSTPPYANDGNLCTAWNGGGYAPRWWMVDLGSVRTFRGVTLVAEMSPNGSVTHEIQVSTNGSTFSTARAISQSMVGGGLYSFDLGSASGRYVRIMTNSSPSWIAWREVAVFACP